MVAVYAATAAPYNIFADLSGDGVVNLNDVQIVRRPDRHGIVERPVMSRREQRRAGWTESVLSIAIAGRRGGRIPRQPAL